MVDQSFVRKNDIVVKNHHINLSYRLAREATNGRKVFAINLSAPFIIEFFSDQLSAVLLYADYVFCNESEAAKVTEIIKWSIKYLNVVFEWLLW